MNKDLAISALKVCKTYSLGHDSNPTLKESVLRLGFRKSWRSKLNAVEDVSVEIPWGQSVGIVGRNGSGKSTFLKLIAGITAPSSGTVEVNGRVAPLLELGAGFHPELTGRENIFLTAAVFGIPEKKIRERFDQIVSFAELEGFIDVPVKFYSTGMFLRLGFSVGIQMDPDILLLDEVMAVGDARFREKSAEQILRFRELGKTILFVSHDMGTVRTLCERVLWLDAGRLRFDGPPGEGIVRYRQHLASAERRSGQDEIASAFSVNLLPADSSETSDAFEVGSEVRVALKFHTSMKAREGLLALEFQDEQGTTLHHTEGDFRVGEDPEINLIHIRALNLLPGAYTLTASFHPRAYPKSMEDVLTFTVAQSESVAGQSGTAYLGRSSF